jgi:membrane-associated phospholipid phosphatase
MAAIPGKFGIKQWVFGVQVEALTESCRCNRSSLRRPKLRVSEWETIGFFAYVALISPWFPNRPFLRSQPVLLLLAVVILFGLLARMECIPFCEKPISIVRDFLPIVTTLVAFKEMGLFQPVQFFHRNESVWIRWDDLFLREWHVRSVIEAGGGALPWVLETFYLLVYLAGVVGVVILYLAGCRKRVDGFLSLYVLGTLLAYSLFPYFSSEPPRIAFPTIDAPQVFTAMRRLNLWILAHGTIHSAVFPSAHVSSAFSAAWAMFFALPRRKAFGWAMLLYAVGVSVATVYGRYHYLADAVAGLGISVAAAGIFWIGRSFSNGVVGASIRNRRLPRV